MAERKGNPGALELRVKLLEAKLAATEARLKALENVQTFEPLRSMAAAPAPVHPQNQWPPVGRQMAPALQPAQPRDLERMIGANWLSKLGMVVLILGVAFFLRYAIEQGWITIPARVVLGVLGGIAIFTTGDLLRWWDARRFNAYAQVLAGGGAVITFFSLFAAYQFPEYRAATGMTLELDAVLLGTTAAGLAVYAAIRKTPILAMEAVGLGALASLFGSTFSGFSVVYTVLLAGAVVAAATWRRWPVVLAVTVLASFVSFVVLHGREVDPWHILFGTLGLLALFVLAPLTGRKLAEERLQGIWAAVTGGSVLAAWGLLLWSLHRIGRGVDTWDGPITGILALGALFLGVYARGSHINARWGWAAAFLVTSVAWPGLQFEETWQAFGWAALAGAAAALLWWRDHALVRGYAAIAGMILVVRLVSVETSDVLDGRLDPWDALPAYALGFAGLLTGWFLCGRKGTRDEAAARIVLGTGVAIPLLYAFAVLDGFAVPIAWTLEAVVLVVVGFMFSQRDLRYSALVIFGLVLIRIFFVDLLELDLAVRIITFLVVGGLLLVASFLFARRKRGVADPAPQPTMRP